MADADHLVFSRIIIKPDNAESISIINPTDESINLSNYYICDDKEYYQIALPPEDENQDMSPSSSSKGFTAQFPNIDIDPNDTLLLVLSEDYSSFYTDITPDLFLFGEESGHMTETESGSFGNSSFGKLHDVSESIILFKWDGNTENNVEDVDYFIWGGVQGAVEKTGIGDYVEDTQANEQLYFEQVPEDYYAFSRVVGLEEIDEESSGGNGIMSADLTRDDETSENFRQSWEIIALFNLGCTIETACNYDSEAIVDDDSCLYEDDCGECGGENTCMGCTDASSDNYNPDATVDDGSCEDLTSINDIIHNCGDDMGESLACDGKYDLSPESAAECLLYEDTVTTSGVIVDYFDVTVHNGPHSFTIESQNGNRIDFVVWPESSQYQDGFDVTQTDLFTQGVFNNGYLVEVTGKLGAYCDDDELLDIFSEWQVTVEYESDIVILDDGEGAFDPDNSLNVTITPAPFIIIPTLGETLVFSFTVLKETRAIVRIFDLSGRFITSLVDHYYESAGKVSYEEGLAPWDGRDQLGQIVSPGTYIMHLEVFNPVTGETHIDAAPIVVGVKK